MLIQTYQENWVEDFKQLSLVISTAMLGLDIWIEHIGSTSIPGLAAKPIIDIDLVWGKTVAFDAIKLRLENLGYYHNGNQGIPHREVFKRNKQVACPVLDFIPHHLYVCPSDGIELQKHLLFKTYLIENAAARLLYQRLKYDIADAALQDRKLYAQLKEERAKIFFEDILAKAGLKDKTSA